MASNAKAGKKGADVSVPGDLFERHFANRAVTNDLRVATKAQHEIYKSEKADLESGNGWGPPECYKAYGISPPKIPNEDLDTTVKTLLHELMANICESTDNFGADKDKVNQACRLFCDRMFRVAGFPQTVHHVVVQEENRIYAKELRDWGVESAMYANWK
ncbi:hypothetical protein PSEUBRA_001127 [Kalmanozyma brasiliensis GHG001]|uniref:uncharacterized protein n=1 Tax=Kalmanozyma brasiliensis (strain GHG001) TaxID=1365824 RepID=UPI002867F343|nr:uncharacterized protein PSEUBRA_001127 [Kalmanozyma brasiliensis GHG001]KAF6766894.1 hypothetical protein PSEUBRA_001127 [Kalmanozyma brasiliensis GHG001]